MIARLLLAALMLLPVDARAAGTATVSAIAFVADRAHYLVEVTETDQRDTSEVTITGLPRCGTITWYRAKLTAGTGTTIHPRLGTAASFTADSYDEVLEATATAAHSHDQPTRRALRSMPSSEPLLRC